MSDNNKTLSEKDLQALGALFEDSLEIEDVDGFDPLPDGEYACEVKVCEIKKTKESQKLMGSWGFQVIEGEEGAGRYIWKNAIFTDNAKNVKRFTNDLFKFGIEVESLAEMIGGCDEVIGEFCLVQLQTDGKGRQWATIDVEEE